MQGKEYSLCEYLHVKLARCSYALERGTSLDRDGLGEGEGHRGTAEGDPCDGGLGTDDIGADGAARGRARGDGDGDRHGAGVSVLRADGDRVDGFAITGEAVGDGGLALVKGHAVREVLADIVLLEGGDGPVGQAGDLLGNGLDPGLDERHPRGLGANGDGRLVGVAHVGLVEHVGVGLETEQIAGILVLGLRKKRVEVSRTPGRVYPLRSRASKGMLAAVFSKVWGQLMVSQERLHIAKPRGQSGRVKGMSGVTYSALRLARIHDI